MELTCTDPPWAGIDPDLIISGELSLPDLERYWTAPMGDVGKRAECCNCKRVLPITESGLCHDCHGVAAGKQGSGLLNALTLHRARVVKVDPVPTGKIGTSDEFSPPKVVGKINLPTPRPPSRKIDAPAQCKREAQADEAEGIRVVDEDGNDLGRLRSYGEKIPSQMQPSAEAETPTPVTRHRPIIPKIRRALIVEVGDVELEFRAGCDGLDIKIDDGTGVIFFAQNMALSLIAELQALADSAKEGA